MYLLSVNRCCVRWAMVLATIVLCVGAGRVAVAQICCYVENVDTRAGIELAVRRYYQPAENAGTMVAHIYRFDSEANALASLEAIVAEHVDVDLPEDAAIQIDALGPHTRAYTWAYDTLDTDSATTILTVEGSYLYIVSITFTYGGTVDAVALATTTIQEMIAAEAGDDPGEYDDSGYSTGGLWDKLPPGDGESPPGYLVQRDEQLYPAPEADEEEGFDFSTLDGTQQVVERSYIGDVDALATPETAPATTYLLIAAVATFDTAEHAAAAVEPLHANTLTDYAESYAITPESVDPGDLGDQALAEVGTTEEDGLTIELASVLVQADTYVYGVVALGVGTDTGALESAIAVAEAMIATEAGSGEEAFDATGASTGGLWDKLPTDGDDVLGELIPESDEQLYPAVPEAESSSHRA